MKGKGVKGRRDNGREILFVVIKTFSFRLLYWNTKILSLSMLVITSWD